MRVDHREIYSPIPRVRLIHVFRWTQMRLVLRLARWSCVGLGRLIIVRYCITVWRIGHRRKKRMWHFRMGRNGDGGSRCQAMHVEVLVIHSVIYKMGCLDKNS